MTRAELQAAIESALAPFVGQSWSDCWEEATDAIARAVEPFASARQFEAVVGPPTPDTIVGTLVPRKAP